MSDQIAYNVYLGRKLIDTVFYEPFNAPNIRDNESVRKYLVNHDGYDTAIRVVTPRRKMETEYVIQGWYTNRWEDVNTETSLVDAKRSLKEYNENEPYPHRRINRRVPISARS